MKRRYLASALSVIALFTSTTLNSANAVTFTPPINNGAPNQATGGASRGNFFIPASSKSAPSQATGGASRGSLFTPSAGKSAPRQATGGASRGSLFTPSAGKSAPRQATGGASRGDLFTPNAGKGAPRQATGGASRGELFTPSAEKNAPQQASGGASRVGTYYLNPSTVGAAGPAALIALLPQSFYGTTVSERPTILVYLPASNAEEAVFSLKDEAGNTQYQMTIPVALKAGVVAVKLPAEAPALAVGKNYHWFLAVKVDGQLGPNTPYVDGWIQRIQPNAELTIAMEQKDALKRAAAFGKQGVWYDCVETLAALHSTQPSNVTLNKQWEELLSSVSLKEIVTAPLLVSTK
ncbi:DUF928 domain-containing protein [Nostoc sp. UCD121]|uniref:DUF928 domain-containing protein n=1 Tax=unclassified Nostoc TaxID=2593658 RepID=UPI00162632CC|nr:MULTISPECIES: DUF928 domain-containing protein [unclassified Nostoc]MBC1224240.1 DUF928 domain-containing protein [Nostoc sp. UCD120]MBC1276973.1 DUF928 domain-containing protein [Nostoc sp. UCD121]MBC1294374.1 DUF928 domain-containing protein [Nostoc sp. UCD122]